LRLPGSQGLNASHISRRRVGRRAQKARSAVSGRKV